MLIEAEQCKNPGTLRCLERARVALHWKLREREREKRIISARARARVRVCVCVCFT
jgi:hypothetical protein